MKKQNINDLIFDNTTNEIDTDNINSIPHGAMSGSQQQTKSESSYYFPLSGIEVDEIKIEDENDDSMIFLEDFEKDEAASATQKLLELCWTIIRYAAYYTPHLSIFILAFLANWLCNEEAGVALGAPFPLPLFGAIGGSVSNFILNLMGWLAFYNTGRFKIWDVVKHGSTSDRIKVLLIILSGAAAAASIFATSYNGIIANQKTIWRDLGGESLNNKMAWVVSFLNFVWAIFLHIYYLHKIVIKWLRGSEQSSAYRAIRRMMYQISTYTSEQAREAILALRSEVEELSDNAVQGKEFLNTLDAKLVELEKMSEEMDLSSTDQHYQHSEEDMDGRDNLPVSKDGIWNTLKQFIGDLFTSKKLDPQERIFAKDFYDFVNKLHRSKKNVIYAMLVKTQHITKESTFDYWAKYKAVLVVTAVLGTFFALAQVFGIGNTAYQFAYGLSKSVLLAAVATLIWTVLGGPAKFAMYITSVETVAGYLCELPKLAAWYINGLSSKAKIGAGATFGLITAFVGASGFCTTDTTVAFLCWLYVWFSTAATQANNSCDLAFLASSMLSFLAMSYIWSTYFGAISVNLSASYSTAEPMVIKASEKKYHNVGEQDLSALVKECMDDLGATFPGTPDGILNGELLDSVYEIIEHPVSPELLVENPDLYKANKKAQQDVFITLLKTVDEQTKPKEELPIDLLNGDNINEAQGERITITEIKETSPLINTQKTTQNIWSSFWNNKTDKAPTEPSSKKEWSLSSCVIV
ncbi:MAG: hypothetical protein HKM04_04100 [Legionellales bacterium]|nr:hypothetical protein [Legionellales bacterium]